MFVNNINSNHKYGRIKIPLIVQFRTIIGFRKIFQCLCRLQSFVRFTLCLLMFSCHGVFLQVRSSLIIIYIYITIFILIIQLQPQNISYPVSRLLQTWHCRFIAKLVALVD